VLDPAASSLAVVVFGLGASLVWGLSDFGGGLSARRAPLAGVLVVAQSAGLAFALVATAIRGEPPVGAPFTATDLGLSVVAGLCGTVGLSALYRGLSGGRMGVVAPVAGVVSTSIPVLAGIALEGLPPALVVAGMGLAVVAVVLVSQVGEGEPGRPSGLRWALVSGLGMGTFALAASRLGPGLLFGPIVVVRIIQIAIFIAAIGARRLPWRVPGRVIPLVLTAGVLDVVGNALFLASIQSGALAVAAVTSSLFPVVTAILAVLVLREHVTRIHAVGIAAAAVAIALIAGGSAG
jgi:drug/metabolite transporter (DMT)-like permease